MSLRAGDRVFYKNSHLLRHLLALPKGRNVSRSCRCLCRVLRTEFNCLHTNTLVHVGEKKKKKNETWLWIDLYDNHKNNNQKKSSRKQHWTKAYKQGFSAVQLDYLSVYISLASVSPVKQSMQWTRLFLFDLMWRFLCQRFAVDWAFGIWWHTNLHHASCWEKETQVNCVSRNVRLISRLKHSTLLEFRNWHACVTDLIFRDRIYLAAKISNDSLQTAHCSSNRPASDVHSA